MEGKSGDFHDDWEMLYSSETETEIEMVKASFLDENLRDFEGWGDEESRGINIRSDYFSVDPRYEYQTILGSNLIDSCSESLSTETTSLIIYVLDSTSDPSVDRESVDSGLKNELRIGEILTLGKDNSSNVSSSSGEDRSVMESGDEGKGTELEFCNKEIGQRFELLGHENGRNDESIAPFKGEAHDTLVENEAGMENGAIRVAKLDVEEERRRIVWWKLPLELLKYSLFKGSSVWSVSMGVALMGVLLLGRSLYKMKSKRRTLQLKVTVDDKKVSQFMQSAARLNEAFSVVRRVPMIGPLPPAPGVTPWPVMNLI